MPHFENDLSKPLAYVSSALNACQAFDILFVCICQGIRAKEKDSPAGRSPIQKIWLSLPCRRPRSSSPRPHCCGFLLYYSLIILFSSPAPRSRYGNQDRSFLRLHNHTTPRWRYRKAYTPDCREATPGRFACSRSEVHPGSDQCS